MQDSKKDTDVYNGLLDSEGEGEGGTIWENGNSTLIIAVALLNALLSFLCPSQEFLCISVFLHSPHHWPPSLFLFWSSKKHTDAFPSLENSQTPRLQTQLLSLLL